MARKLTHLPPQAPPARSPAWPCGLLVALCFTTLPLFLAMSPGRPSLSDMWQQMGVRVTVTYDSQDATKEAEPSGSPTPPESRDVLLGGLLSPDIDKNTCLSRYQSSLYRKPSPHSPSPYLVSRLRKYEALHRKCGPGTLSYNKYVAQLAAAHSLGLVECSYLVWTPSGSGHHLADRMLSMASAFLYALLTGRVFLVHATNDIAGLFCEPFPGATSWELPCDFPLLKNLTELHRGSERSYGNLVVGAKKAANDSYHPAAVLSTAAESLPSYAYVHLERDYQLPDQLFFCDDDQAVLGKVNWLVLRSDLYFAPGLFLVPRFEDELRWMFPAPDTVFHHVGRYLFHPSNEVWALIARHHTSHMFKFEENKIGVHVAAVSWNPVTTTEEYLKQIAACTSQEKILPEVDPDAASSEHEAASSATSSTAVLVSASEPRFAEWLKTMYDGHTTVTGEAVSVLQLTSAGKQPRNQKEVLVEMFLQSYCDVSVMSGGSTVGYVSHGLAGVKPWLLLAPPRNRTRTEAPCVRTTSMEPCFLAPPNYDCRAKQSGGVGAVLRHVRHCEDVSEGLKLFY
ncbi:hypothetical protein EJB05_43317, partial [Eragrostis curvula]